MGTRSIWLTLPSMRVCPELSQGTFIISGTREASSYSDLFSSMPWSPPISPCSLDITTIVLSAYPALSSASSIRPTLRSTSVTLAKYCARRRRHPASEVRSCTSPPSAPSGVQVAAHVVIGPRPVDQRAAVGAFQETGTHRQRVGIVEAVQRPGVGRVRLEEADVEYKWPAVMLSQETCGLVAQVRSLRQFLGKVRARQPSLV